MTDNTILLGMRHSHSNILLNTLTMQTEQNLTAFREFSSECVESEIRRLRELLTDLEIKIAAGNVTNDGARTLISARVQKFALRVETW